MILACRQLHKAYGIDVILEKITFHIEEREKAAIVGVNGAGKTTLFKVLTGEISADGGEFYLKKDASLGYLAQNIQIDSDRTIYEEMLSVFEKIIQTERRTGIYPMSWYSKEIWEYIAPRYGIVLEEWNHDIDHVHVMFRAQPKTELSKFINAYKSASSRLLKKEYPEIREKLWKEAFWSQSFCLLTAGGAPVEVIRQYIETQGEKKN